MSLTNETDEPSVSKNDLELEETVLALKREKRARKTNVTKIRHNLEKLCAQKSKLNRGFTKVIRSCCLFEMYIRGCHAL